MQRIFLLLVLSVGFLVNAQVKQEIFESFKLQERRDVQYYFPENLDDTKKYPLVIVLDGNYLFDQVVATSKFYSRFHGMPESIVVGINQSKDDLRYEDCAFEPDSGLPSEKGKKFFEFLGMELIPYLDLNFSTAPFKMIVGYDITANFQNYWLFKDNSLFNAYISDIGTRNGNKGCEQIGRI
jgi:predicted alpha/beta superfamily hydrolase